MQLRLLLTSLSLAAIFCTHAQNTSPYWSLAGNSNASASSKLGTTNAVPLRLITKNVARLVIDTAGRIAIGLNTPAARLHVNTSATTPPLLLQVNGLTKLLAGTNGGLSIGSNFSAPANGLFVAGNVGIGTNVPVRKLQVQDGDIRISRSASVSRYLEFSTTEAGQNSVRFEHSFGGSTLFLSRSGDNFTSFGDIAFFSLAPSPGYRFTVLGNAYASGGTWQASDSKLKTEVADLSSATVLLSKLQPKTYFFKQEGYAALGLSKQKQYGFVAQELEQVLPELVNTSEMPVSKGSTGERVMEEVKAVNYTALIPIMVKGMQEQEERFVKQESENKALKAEVAELRQMILELKNGRTGTLTSTSAYLEQNTPNPVNGSTTIRYHVPETSTSARFTLTNAKGQVLKTINLSNRGTGQLNLNTNSLAAGTYNYTLYVNGRQADSKRLVIIR
jgi:hypothetical protein